MVASQGASFVYVIAKDSLSLDRRVAVGVALLYAVNPVIAYMVWQSFGGQMLATPLLLGVTYLATRALTEPANVKAQFCYLPSLVFLFSGLLLTYHFMMGFVCVLLAIYVTIVAVCETSLKRILIGTGLLASSLALTFLLDPFRIPENSKKHVLPFRRCDGLVYPLAQSRRAAGVECSRYARRHRQGRTGRAGFLAFC